MTDRLQLISLCCNVLKTSHFSESNISYAKIRWLWLLNMHLAIYTKGNKIPEKKIKIHHRPFFLILSLFETNNWLI